MDIVKDDAGTPSTTANDLSVTTTDAPAAAPAAATEPQDRRSVIAAALESYEEDDEAAKPAAALPPATAPAPAPQAPLADPATGRPMEPMKAPNSWTPALREKWGSIDPTVQQFILNRERHMAVTLQETAEARKFQKEFADVWAPMGELMRQNNWQGSTMQVLKNNLDMAVALNTGTPQQKAVIFVNLLRHFQPDAETIRSLLAGQSVNVPPMQAPQAPSQAPTQPSRDELLEEARSQEAFDQFAADPSNEFFNDVRKLMAQVINAGLIDETSSYAEQLKEAYEMACARHPEVKQVLASRQPTQPTAPVAQPRDDAGRFAATPPPAPVRSVKPSLGSGRPSSAPKTYKNRRDAALEAFEELQAAQR